MNGHGLPEPAMQLWRDYGDLLRRELGPLGAANWQLGGGTVLAKDWHHRRSFDLDITIATTVDSRKTRTAMVAIRDECTRRDLEVDDDVANRLLRVKTGLTDDHGNESGLDLWVHDPGIPGPARIEQIGDLQIAVLSKPQIIYGKLQRSNEGLIRDAYDIAHARVKDRRALETAVNSLDPNHQQRAEMAYGTRSKLMELEPGQILGWSGKTADDQTGCGMRASHAIHDSRWTRLVIRAQEGRIFAETTNTAGETLNWLGENGTPIPKAVEHLETAGIISHLQNQYAGQNCNLADIVRRIAGSIDRLETIVHTEPGPSTNKTPRASVFTGETGPEPPRIGGPQRPKQPNPRDDDAAGMPTSTERKTMTRNQHDGENDDLGQIDWQDCPHVERDTEIMSGAWCFEGTRLPVSALFTNLASGLSIPEFIEQFPNARAEHINAVLNFQADRLDTTSNR